MLIDEQATKDNIKNEMRDLVAKVTPNDSVVFYISSHGTPPNMLGKMGVVPYDLKLASSIKSENIQKEADAISSDEKGDEAVIEIAKARIESLKTALAFDDLQDFISGIKTNKFVALLDTCYSGGALKAISYPVAGGVYARKEDSFVQSQSQENMRDMVGNGAICEKSGYDQKRIQSLSAAFSVSNSNKGGKNLFVDGSDTSEKNQNVTHSTSKKVVGNDYDYSWLEDYRLLQNLYGLSEIDHGKVIITASSGEEKSWTADEFQTSIFTNYFLKGLNSYKGTYSAFDYAKVRTEKAAMDIKRHHQTPQMTSSPAACANINLSK